jgi:hypothetical protein
LVVLVFGLALELDQPAKLALEVFRTRISDISFFAFLM